MKPFFNGEDTRCWTVIIKGDQDRDDDSPSEGDNIFDLSMHLSPGGGWYWRIKGEVALDFDEMPALKEQLETIAQTLNWR